MYFTHYILFLISLANSRSLISDFIQGLNHFKILILQPWNCHSHEKGINMIYLVNIIEQKKKGMGLKYDNQRKFAQNLCYKVNAKYLFSPYMYKIILYLICWILQPQTTHDVNLLQSKVSAYFGDCLQNEMINKKKCRILKKKSVQSV